MKLFRSMFHKLRMIWDVVFYAVLFCEIRYFQTSCAVIHNDLLAGGKCIFIYRKRFIILTMEVARLTLIPITNYRYKCIKISRLNCNISDKVFMMLFSVYVVSFGCKTCLADAYASPAGTGSAWLRRTDVTPS